MQFRDGASTLDIGGFQCATTCSFTNLLEFESPSVFGPSGTVAVSVSAVPEPSTWAMLLLGFAGLGFAGYRHTRMNRVASAAA
jgi:hypothetical protein